MLATFGKTVKRLIASARYRLDDGSMSPALRHGDQVLAVRGGEPYRRGDVVVFKQPFQVPDAPTQVYIKRIIGLPQEEIFFDEGMVRINGSVLLEDYLTDNTKESEGSQVRETARIWITDPGEYFVLGDRRDDSRDSRNFGPVSESLFMGRVWLRYWPIRDWSIISGDQKI
jgi:signal peptidase I